MKEPYIIAVSSAINSPKLLKELENVGIHKYYEAPLTSAQIKEILVILEKRSS